MDKQLLEKNLEEVESIIYSYLPKEEGRIENIVSAMNYSVIAGGKRLRPTLIRECARLFSGGRADEEVKPFMAAIECIHTYSLVHDDLPAMDNDEYRRGKLTTHKKYGEAAGILAGDGLLNYAYELMSEAVVNSKEPLKSSKAMCSIAKNAGVYGMVGGQSVDVALVGLPVDKPTLDFIYDLKTCALIEASMVAGAILGGASDEECDKVIEIAKRVGFAFQVRDDILDVTSTLEELGKPVLSDQKNDKTTYVTLYGIDKATAIVNEISDEALKLYDELESSKAVFKNAFLRDLLVMLVNRKK